MLCVEDNPQLSFPYCSSGIQSGEEKGSRPAPGGNDGSRIPPQAKFTSVYGGLEKKVNVRITAKYGRGFPVKKRGLGKKADVPDVYCSMKLTSENSRPISWKTQTIKDDTMPQWNEIKVLNGVSTTDVLRVKACDKNKKGADDVYGISEVSIEILLRKRILEMELFDGENATGCYVTFMAVRAPNEIATANSYGTQKTYDEESVGDYSFNRMNSDELSLGSSHGFSKQMTKVKRSLPNMRSQLANTSHDIKRRITVQLPLEEIREDIKKLRKSLPDQMKRSKSEKNGEE